MTRNLSHFILTHRWKHALTRAEMYKNVQLRRLFELSYRKMNLFLFVFFFFFTTIMIAVVDNSFETTEEKYAMSKLEWVNKRLRRNMDYIWQNENTKMLKYEIWIRTHRHIFQQSSFRGWAGNERVKESEKYSAFFCYLFMNVFCICTEYCATCHITPYRLDEILNLSQKKTRAHCWSFYVISSKTCAHHFFNPQHRVAAHHMLKWLYAKIVYTCVYMCTLFTM